MATVIVNGGSISLNAHHDHGLVAAASDAHNCLVRVLLVMRNCESLTDLNKALVLADDEGVFTAEVNDSTLCILRSKAQSGFAGRIQ